MRFMVRGCEYSLMDRFFDNMMYKIIMLYIIVCCKIFNKVNKIVWDLMQDKCKLSVTSFLQKFVELGLDIMCALCTFFTTLQLFQIRSQVF